MTFHSKQSLNYSVIGTLLLILALSAVQMDTLQDQVETAKKANVALKHEIEVREDMLVKAHDTCLVREAQ